MHKIPGSGSVLPGLHAHGVIWTLLPTRVTPPNIPKVQKDPIMPTVGNKNAIINIIKAIKNSYKFDNDQ